MAVVNFTYVNISDFILFHHWGSRKDIEFSARLQGIRLTLYTPANCLPQTRTYVTRTSLILRLNTLYYQQIKIFALRTQQHQVISIALY